jgi:nudix-type nucleoside diphosphatase (YffH/AdpP family)
MTRVISAETARKGYVTVTVLTMADGDGPSYLREVASHGQSACVLPYDPARKVAWVISTPRAPLIFQGIEAPLLEAPAGMIDAGETGEVAARREAFEEVGLALGALEPVAVAWPSPGIMAERSHLFLAAYEPGDRRGAGGGLAREHEGIVAQEVALGELWRLAEAGELHDLKTLTLVQALRIRRPQLF